MNGYGIGSFIDGFFKGAEIRHGWDDRKQNIERQKRADEIMAAQEARAQQSHELQMQTGGLLNRQRQQALRASDREWQDAQDYRDAVDKDMAAADGYGTRPSGDVAQAAPQVSQSSQSAVGIRPESIAPVEIRETTPGFGVRPIESGAAPRTAAAAMGAIDRAAAQRSAGTPPIRPVASGTAPRAAAATAKSLDDDVAMQREREAMTYERWRGLSREQRRRLGLPLSELGGQVHFNRFREGLGEPTANALETAGRFGAGVVDRTLGGLSGAWDYAAGLQMKGAAAAADAVGADETADEIRRGAAYQMNKGDEAFAGGVSAVMSRPDVDYMVPRDEFSATPPKRFEAAERAAAAEDRSQPVGPLRTKALIADAAPTTPSARESIPQETVRAAAEPARGSGPVARSAVQAAVVSAPEAAPAIEAGEQAVKAVGARPGLVMTEGQMQRGERAFTQNYMQTGAPNVVNTLIRQGRVREAQDFMNFLDTAQTRAGMKSWARATVAASVGDFDTFGDQVLSGLSTMGYFGPDVVVDREASGFTDSKGNLVTRNTGDIAGARVVLRNTSTGQVSEQVFDNKDDLIHLGIGMLDPKNMFDIMQREQESARTQAVGIRDRAEKARDGRRDRVDKRAQSIYEAAMKNSLGGEAPMTPQQAYQQAEEIERQLEDGSLGNPATSASAGGTVPPIARRPQG